jgi:nucleoside phosphorylase
MFLYKSKKIVIVKSGIGTSLAAACTELFIHKFKPTKVFNYGAVGGSDKVKQFDVIIPSRIYYHDVITP